MTQVPPEPSRRIRFDWTFNLGHLLTIASLAVGGIALWTSLALQISSVDMRTADYPTIRDQTKANTQAIDALKTAQADQSLTLRAALSDQAATNRQMVDAIGGVKTDVAGISASVKIILDATPHPGPR